MANTDINRTFEDRPTPATGNYIALGFWIRAGIVGVGALVAGIALLLDPASGHGWVDASILAAGGGALAAFAGRRTLRLLDEPGAPAAAEPKKPAAESIARVRVSTIAS